MGGKTSQLSLVTSQQVGGLLQVLLGEGRMSLVESEVEVIGHVPSSDASEPPTGAAWHWSGLFHVEHRREGAPSSCRLFHVKHLLANAEFLENPIEHLVSDLLPQQLIGLPEGFPQIRRRLLRLCSERSRSALQRLLTGR